MKSSNGIGCHFQKWIPFIWITNNQHHPLISHLIFFFCVPPWHFIYRHMYIGKLIDFQHHNGIPWIFKRSQRQEEKKKKKKQTKKKQKIINNKWLNIGHIDECPMCLLCHCDREWKITSPIIFRYFSIKNYLGI